MRKLLPLINFLLLIGIISYLIYDTGAIKKEIKVERVSIVDEDGNLFIAISNPEKQALATQNGKIIHPENTNRDLPGIIFFNRVGDEVGGIYYDGTENENYAGITFDQQKNDQIMAIMKDEYKEGDEWKRWYGMFFRERSDSIRVKDLYENFQKRVKNLPDSIQQKEYLKFKQFLDSEINIYRMFLGREESKNVGLFLYDSKGRKRIKLYVDENDNAKLQVIDTDGSSRDLFKN